MIERSASSHKGENGKVAVVGGCDTMHGAPLFAARAAEAAGVDLIYVELPRCHEEVAKSTSLNFQVSGFFEDNLSRKDVKPILELLATIDCAVIGPGVSHLHAAGIGALLQIVAEASCPMVLDAVALQENTLSLIQGKRSIVLTPHLGELERMVLVPNQIGPKAQETGATICLKGDVDRIASYDGSITEIKGGNAGLTVGGTGDALAGLIAGLIAQRTDPFEASVIAAKTIKRAGTLLQKKKGFSYTTSDVIEQIPHLLITNN